MSIISESVVTFNFAIAISSRILVRLKWNIFHFVEHARLMFPSEYAVTTSNESTVINELKFQWHLDVESYPLSFRYTFNMLFRVKHWLDLNDTYCIRFSILDCTYEYPFGKDVSATVEVIKSVKAVDILTVHLPHWVPSYFPLHIASPRSPQVMNRFLCFLCQFVENVR